MQGQKLDVEVVDEDQNQSESIVDSYSDRKKFWEAVSGESEITISRKKRMSLFEEPSITERHILAKKRTSIHELSSSTPPVPKPRSVLQSSLSNDSDKEDTKGKLSEASISESTGSMPHTELTRISESEKIDEQTKPITEYQASFKPPSQIIDSKEKFEELQKTDSLDSDYDVSQSQAYENTGYISDSGDVEHYISDSEIEDRVPQIRERQMSIAVPVPSARKTIYERSASLPTEDLYEVSARSVKLRKQYYEQQIKKEMIAEQLTSEVEDEPSPERKALASLEVEEEILPSGMRSAPEKVDEDVETDLSSVRDLAKTFGSTVYESKKIKKEQTDKTTAQGIPEKTNDDKVIDETTKPRSVKDLAKGFEKELGTVIAGQKIGQPPVEMKGFVIDKHSKIEETTKDIKDFQEIVYDTKTHKPDTIVSTHKEVRTKEEATLDEEEMKYTHKITDTETHKTSRRIKSSSTESDQSVSSGRSAGTASVDEVLSQTVEGTSRPGDSMEVHVDKSEIEDSEKLTEIEQDLETKSLDSLTAVSSDEHIPEITVTLSGKQRRISEESDEYEDKTQKVTQSKQASKICQPEEHVQDTVWEVSIQSQPNITFEEKAIDIAPESQILTEKESKVAEYDKQAEKDDDLSGSVRDESDLGSEIHQDHSDSYASDKIKSESHSEIEKIILDSLHQQKVDPEEAKKIASALIEDIETEIQKRQSITDTTETVTHQTETSKIQVSDYLRQLAESKGLDEREVQLVESVLARRQRELAKLARGDTDASSMEITDEDLRYSGAEIDYSNILEQQIDQLQHEKSLDDMKSVYDTLEKEYKDYEDKESKVDITDDKKTKESIVHKDYETCEDGKITAYKSDIQTKSSESVKGEKRSSEKRDAIIEEDETALDSIVEEADQLEMKSEVQVAQKDVIISEGHLEKKQSSALVEDESLHVAETTQKTLETTTKEAKRTLEQKETTEKDVSKLSGIYSSDTSSRDKFDDGSKETSVTKQQKVDQLTEKEMKSDVQHLEENKRVDDIEISKTMDKKHTKISSTVMSSDHSHQVSTSVISKTLGEAVEADLEKLIASGNLALDKEKSDIMKPVLEGSEIVIVEHEQVTRSYSNESKSSQEESIKSPDEQFSTCSSGRKADSDTIPKTPEKHDVILRKTRPRKDGDTSSSSGNLKLDRKSGIDFETYSSSGESHYHSFELDSGKSRPCSSDVEGLFAAGSSEYESALTSQDISAPSHMTDYHTAVSSLSSKESMKSLDSESSGNLASVEVSEASETLVPSTFEVDGDILEHDGDEWTDRRSRVGTRQSTELSDSEAVGVEGSIDISEDDSVNGVKIPTDTQSKMKRSQEMTFQPEPKSLVPESPQSDEVEEKFGTSLDDGSVLSMSVSSTSSASALRTVIELSRADSERQEGSMTISGTSEQLSLEELDNLPRGSRESLVGSYTLTRQTMSDMSTSTPPQTSDSGVGSVTLTTSTIAENGIQNVSTQVTSETHTPETEQNAIPEYDDVPKKKGHRRQESTTFIPSKIALSKSEVEHKIQSDLAESDKYTSHLSFKEVASDEKKDIDETEKDECYETEADQGFHRDMREGRYLETESDVDADGGDASRPQSQISKSDSERDRAASLFSDDRLESELIELAKQSSSEGTTDPIERPVSPEPFEESEIQKDASIFSASDLDNESVASNWHTIDSKKTKITDILPEKVSSATSSEKSSFEEAEAEAAFSMVAHVSPAHKAKQICPILEDEAAEKHELEVRERAQKEYEERRAQMRDQSPGAIPDIKITQHMTPLVDNDFHYPDLEYERKQRIEEEAKAELEKEKEEVQTTPQTPASNSSKSSEETDQGREYTLEDSSVSIPEGDEKGELTESKSDLGTVVEKTLYESDKETSRSESQASDSFEMLEKPDLIDDFVVIEEVAREAHELDMEGKSVKITTTKKVTKKTDKEIEEYLVKSAPAATSTKMTDVKYYPDGSSSDELGFEFEDSPPQDQQGAAATKTGRDYVYEYDRELEANKKWIEQQFQGDQAAMIAAGYGYEMDFERGPLEDIKEEDINDFDPTSSRIGSLGSQKESGGSLSSVKESFSSTPEYDVLAGRKYFTRSGEHDDVSMSSLQEFENLERAMSLENRRCHQGSQDSLSNGSFGKRYYASRSGQGDDVSVSSLKEFEGLEKACIDAHKIEIKVKEEEAMLAQIDEGQESIASESGSCETISGTDKKVIPDSDEEDYEKRMFEIDEIIKQAQTNVERFTELKECEKTESIGRGDSYEEVSKVPDLDLDTPLVKTTATKVQWAETDDVMATSTDSLDLKPDKPSHHDSTDSLEQKTTAGDIMTASTDSIEFQARKSARDNIMTDSIEIKDDHDKSYMVSSDSLELHAGTSTNAGLSDSIDEDGSRIGGHDQSSSSGKDFSSSVREEVAELPDLKHRMEAHMLSSTDSLEPSSSAATHATYQYETDSVFSGSFTSGGSNTMVSSTDTIEPGHLAKETIDIAAAVRKVWFDEEGGKRYSTEYIHDGSKPYVTEVIEPCEGDGVYSHTIHRKVELPPDIRKITFTGPDADEQMKRFVESFGEGEEVQESEEVDSEGNVHVKRVVQKRIILPDAAKHREAQISDPKIQQYLQQFGDSSSTSESQTQGLIRRTYTDAQGTKTIYTQQFGLPTSDQQDPTSVVRDLLTSIAGDTGSFATYMFKSLFLLF